MVASHDVGLEPQPYHEAFRVALVQCYVRNLINGGPDKAPSGLLFPPDRSRNLLLLTGGVLFILLTGRVVVELLKRLIWKSDLRFLQESLPRFTVGGALNECPPCERFKRFLRTAGLLQEMEQPCCPVKIL